jgi:hypothetical protein
VLEDLHGLAEVGVVHEAEPGKWMVTHFAKWQAAIPVDERVRQFRERNGGVTKDVTKSYKTSNEVEVGPSTSPSYSDSESLREETKFDLPRTPAEAMVHPDARVYTAVTGGRIPGLSQYQNVMETVRLLRARERMDDAALRIYLGLYWLAWSAGNGWMAGRMIRGISPGW